MGWPGALPSPRSAPRRGGHLEDCDGCVVGRVDHPAVHCPAERKAHDDRDIAMVDDGVGVRGVQTETRREGGHRGEVPVAVAVDEGQPHDGPGQPAVAQERLGGQLARRVGGGWCSTRRSSRPGRVSVGVVDVARARHDEAGLGRVRLDGLDQVAGAVEVGPPDRVVVGRAEERREVDDRVDALHRLAERARVAEVAAHAGRPGRQRRGRRGRARGSRPVPDRRGSSRDPTRPLAPVSRSVVMMFSLPDRQYY